ncbi:hypothetical protein BO226_24580 (plasmid) [Rhodococcus sp. 2G]|nr:hypothetical protein BO226_24580 [Rhodococcus sp. 2G]
MTRRESELVATSKNSWIVSTLKVVGPNYSGYQAHWKRLLDSLTPKAGRLDMCLRLGFGNT